MFEATLPVVAAVLGAVRSVRVRRYTVNVDAYDATAMKLIHAGNLDRLSKLGRAAAGMTYPAAIDAALSSVLAAGPHYPEPLAAAGARDAFVRVHEAAMRRFGTSPLVDLVQIGLGPGVAAWIFWQAGSVPPEATAGGALALLLALDVMRQRARLRRADVGRAAPILDAMVQASSRPGTSTPDAGPARYLRVTRGGQLIESFELDAPIVKIGRDPASHIVLDDAAVSRMHAVLEQSDETLTVIDLGSETGTLVNGERVNRHELRDGDRLGIGPFEILVAPTPGPGGVAPGPALVADPGRRCEACGSRGFAALLGAPESVVPAGYRGEHCQNCGKVELFKIMGGG